MAEVTVDFHGSRLMYKYIILFCQHVMVSPAPWSLGRCPSQVHHHLHMGTCDRLLPPHYSPFVHFSPPLVPSNSLYILTSAEELFLSVNDFFFCQWMSALLSSHSFTPYKVTIGPQGFYCLCPSIWNSLPVSLRDFNLSLETFRRKLKLHLFTS